MIEFTASIHRVSMDKDSETTLTLKMPKSELAQCVHLLQLTEKALVVKMEVAPS